MDSNHPVYEISSDEEEEGLQETGNLDWFLSELLNEDVEKEGDEVVMLDESSSVLGNPNKRFKAWESKDEDDDCVILDGDPDKPASDDNESPANHGSEDLLIVGEKGQVACRDYPHPRHLCLKFPFISTPHEKLCDLCHCYACDAPAPCLYWGTGISFTDHCHATDKSTMWKDLRAKVTTIKKIPAPVPKLLQPNFAPQHAVSEPNPSLSVPTAVRVCSSATNSPRIPNIISHKSGPGYFLPRNKFQTQAISKQLLTTRVSDSQYISSANGVKRPRPGYPTSNQPGYHYSLSNTNHTTPMQYSRAHRSTRCQEREAVPSQAQMYTQPLPHPNGGQNMVGHGGDYGFSWQQQPPPVEALQVQRRDHMPEIPPAMEFDPQLVSSTNHNEPYYEFNDWLVQNQCSGAGGAPPPPHPLGSVPCDTKILSPEMAYFDEGLPLFDFETPWDPCATFNP